MSLDLTYLKEFAIKLATYMEAHSLDKWSVVIFPNLPDRIEIEKRNNLLEITDNFIIFGFLHPRVGLRIQAKRKEKIIDLDPSLSIEVNGTNIFSEFFRFSDQ